MSDALPVSGSVIETNILLSVVCCVCEAVLTTPNAISSNAALGERGKTVAL